MCSIVEIEHAWITKEQPRKEKHVMVPFIFIQRNSSQQPVVKKELNPLVLVLLGIQVLVLSCSYRPIFLPSFLTHHCGKVINKSKIVTVAELKSKWNEWGHSFYFVYMHCCNMLLVVPFLFWMVPIFSSACLLLMFSVLNTLF